MNLAGAILPQWFPDGDDAVGSERLYDAPHQLAVRRLVEVMHDRREEHEIVSLRAQIAG